MIKSKFDLLIFDWDGTLMDSIDWIVYCLQNAALECGHKAPDEGAAKDIIGLSINQAMSVLFPELDQFETQRLISRYSQLYFSRQLGVEDLFPGVLDLLDALKKSGFMLAVATGKSRKGLQHAFEQTGIGGYFVASRCADETASKPDPLMLKQIIEEIGIRKESAVMIGDSVHDLEMASNAGISSIAVTCGAHAEQQLLPHRPLEFLQNTSDLITFLRLNNGK
ncbi:HAD-IA family hydrolase [Methylicorpusculum sp.]|uniref:HAD-IA family hydrolase n=1 Tax=Methylicorpusculum sp. TaxID=2713644 RepID=UPI002ABA996C|nr:HAD-IA family hydrolase [Methylicorpusculum sp.]MDZ4151501.1 HAD-IA family hydrolase [Methylicorpusculum sp.]